MDNTTERDKKVIELYQSGLGAHRIAKKLEIGKKTVYRILNRHNIKIDKGRTIRKLSTSDINKAIALYVAGNNLSKIAKLFNVDDETIRYHLKKSKVDRRNPADALSAIPHSNQQQVIDWRVKDGLSSYQIAERLNLPYQSIQKFLKLPL